jgi:hypothetical protein
MYKFKGEVIEVKETQVLSEKFCKRGIVISDTQNEYPKDVFFEAQGRTEKDCELLDAASVGDIVEVGFFISSQCVQKEGKPDMWFTTLKVKKVDVIEKAKNASPIQDGGGRAPVAPGAAATAATTGYDDLPF